MEAKIAAQQAEMGEQKAEMEEQQAAAAAMAAAASLPPLPRLFWQQRPPPRPLPAVRALNVRAAATASEQQKVVAAVAATRPSWPPSQPASRLHPPRQPRVLHRLLPEPAHGNHVLRISPSELWICWRERLCAHLVAHVSCSS